MWQQISDLTPKFKELIGFNKEWVDEDFNPEGTRLCFMDDSGWNTSKWDNDYDIWLNDASTPTHWTNKPFPPANIGFSHKPAADSDFEDKYKTQNHNPPQGTK